MTGLCVLSTVSRSGKTALCAGLARRLIQEGRAVGYLRPVADGAADPDAEFMARLVGLGQAVEWLCPSLSSPGAVKRAYDALARDRDVVLVEAGGTADLAQSLDARALLLVPYREGLAVDEVAAGATTAEERLLGVVLNGVPERRMRPVMTSFLPALEGRGVRVLGVLPEERGLFTITVGELAAHLGGELLNSQEAAAELVESVMVGAMCLDSGLHYFGTRPGKAALVRGDRPDLQMAALETSTRALILTGGAQPLPEIRYRAEEKGIPLVAVAGDTLSTAAAVEGAFENVRFRQERKLEVVSRLLEKHLDFAALYQGLGLGG